MDKFVITWEEDNGDTYVSEICCLEYESEEALFCLIDDKTEEYKKKLISHYDKSGSLFLDPKERKLQIDKATLDLHSFIYFRFEPCKSSSEQKYSIIKTLPRIEKLDEWFEKKQQYNGFPYDIFFNI
jgi:hypothetical protein